MSPKMRSVSSTVDVDSRRRVSRAALIFVFREVEIALLLPILKLCRGSAAAKPGPRDLCHTLPFFYPRAVHIDLCDSSAAEFFFDSRMMGPKIRRPPLLRLKSLLRSSSRPEHLDVENPSFDPAVVLNRPSGSAVRAALLVVRPQYSHADRIPLRCLGELHPFFLPSRAP